jgi:hypothetical protein
VGQDCKNPKGAHDECHRDNCRRESVCIDHGRDLAAGGQRNKLANSLAAFGLTRVRDSESRHWRWQLRILQHLLCRNGKPAYSALECLHFG